MIRTRPLLQLFAVAIILAAGTIIVFWPLGQFDFINYDDDVLVYNDLHLRQGITWSSIVWAFTSLDLYNWPPLTWISHLPDTQIYGMDPG